MKEYAYKKTKLLLPKWTIMPIAWDGHFRWNMQVNLVQLIIIIFITCYEWDIYAVDIFLAHFKSWTFCTAVAFSYIHFGTKWYYSILWGCPSTSTEWDSWDDILCILQYVSSWHIVCTSRILPKQYHVNVKKCEVIYKIFHILNCRS